MTTSRTRLDRERIVDAALHVIAEGGLVALTARSIAKELDVTAMALYRHFPSVDAILRAAFDRVVDDAQITAHDEPDLALWLHTTFTRIFRAISTHGALVGVLGTDATAGPSALAVVTATMARLEAHGISGARATDVFHTLLSFTVGASALEAGVKQRAAHDVLGRFGGRARVERELDVIVRATLAKARA